MTSVFELASLQELQEAILKTQKNAKIGVVEDTPSGKYTDSTLHI